MQTRPCRGENTVVDQPFSNVPASVANPFAVVPALAPVRLTDRSARTNPNC